MIKVGIMGATGYTGIELLRALSRHPIAQIAWLTSEGSAGKTLGDVFPIGPTLGKHPLIAAGDADLHAADVVFCCLPHAASQVQVAAARRAGARVVDLSADFRLRDPSMYEAWYGVPHTERELLNEAVYGLTEIHRTEIGDAKLVANPGCYPTSVILGLAPLARMGWLRGVVIADSKTGISGAGRKPALKSLFVEANENVTPYSIGRSHRHLAEMEQELLLAGAAAQQAFQIVFSPHLTPVNQGMLSTIYVSLPAGVDETAVRQLYSSMYDGEPFVYVLPAAQAATYAHTARTNDCALGLTFVQATGTLIVTSSIDNLIKGASGQAVQNMNVMFGLDETLGLR